MFVLRFLDGRHYQIGPFKTADAAAKYAIKHDLYSGWVIQQLSAPQK